MLKTSVAVAAAAAALLASGPAAAFDGTGVDQQRAAGQPPSQGQDRNQRRGRTRAQDPETVKATAQAQLTAAGTTCTVTEAANPGLVGEDQLYEAACSEGPGFIVIASTPPQVSNCLELQGSAAIARSRDPNADVGTQCTLPANNNAVAVIGGWARQAGVSCTVDEAIMIGKDGTTPVYEVGCANASGYRLQKAAEAWTLTPCWDIATSGRSCRFTTPAEIKLGWTEALAGTQGAPCDVDQARRVGRDARGLFVFEIKCTSGEGYFARVNDTSWKAEVVATCAESASVGGGCTLTPSAPAPATASQQ